VGGTYVECVFENRAIRRIFGLKRGEVFVEWRRLHNEEIYDLYCSLNTILASNHEE